MLLGVLTALAVLGALVLVVALFLQRGRDGVDLSLGGLTRVYLYLASLAGVIVFTIGVAGVLSYVLAAALGLDVVYGGPRPQIQPAQPFPVCPPGTTCPPFVPPPIQAFPDDRIRQQSDDLVRGVTFLIFGGLFFGAHWWARRALAVTSERTGPLYRAYLILGTAIFGIATIALLPMGIYQALSFAIVPATQFTFRPGAGEALSGGLAALPVWLTFLWLVQRILRTTSPTQPAVA